MVLAYSGGLDTSIIIPWLKENYGCEVIAMIGDVGQQEDLEAARKKALATGASTALVEDLREEFVRDYIWPTLRAGAVYEHTYLLGTSMARPVIAKRQAEMALEARRGRPFARLHRQGQRSGAFRTGVQSDRARTCRSLRRGASGTSTRAKTPSPTRRKHNVPIEQSKKNIYSRDRNIWHLSHEGARAGRSRQLAERSDVAVDRFSAKKLRTRPKKSRSDSKRARRFR